MEARQEYMETFHHINLTATSQAARSLCHQGLRLSVALRRARAGDHDEPPAGQHEGRKRALDFQSCIRKQFIPGSTDDVKLRTWQLTMSMC